MKRITTLACTVLILAVPVASIEAKSPSTSDSPAQRSLQNDGRNPISGSMWPSDQNMFLVATRVARVDLMMQCAESSSDRLWAFIFNDRDTP